MSFRSNPLSLSLQEPALESWLRDSGYLEVLDQRSSSSAASASAPADGAGEASSGLGLGLGFFSQLGTFLSLFTFNPFGKLTTEDLSGQTPSWTHGFLGSLGSYSFPASQTQARLRVQENVKRFSRNYGALFVLLFACSLYQMPFALVGLVSSLALWELLKLSDHKWGFQQRPLVRICLIRIAQCATAVILLCCNIHMALFYSMAVGYVVLMLHAAFRKLASSKQPQVHRRRK